MLNRKVDNGIGRVMGWLWVLPFLCYTGLSQAAGTVCAQVKIEIKQELTLERQAFDAMMRINNGLDTLPINNVKVAVNFEDEDGLPVLASSDPNDTSAKFFIRVDTLDQIADVSGYGSVAPTTTAEIHWLIIPAPGAAENAPTGKLYFVGAKLDYTLGGEPESVVVTPDFITVKPLPQLTLDYFLTQEVNADDPLTPAIEPSEPYTLGVRVRNSGLAAAKGLKIDSAQPKIIENEQGLLIGFEITGSSVDDEPVAPVLLIDFGDVAGNSAKVGRWEMLSTLAGEFVDFTATFTHADELGGALTSILEATNPHLLVRDVRVDLPGRDGVRDFLARDGDILRVYESDSVDTVVTDQSAQAGFVLASQSGTLVDYTLSYPATSGFSYVKLPDPYGGAKAITQVVRSDGKVISPDNAWRSKTRNKSTHPYSWSHYLNFFDSNTTGTYAVRLDTEVLGPVPPVLQYIPPKTTFEGRQVGFVVEASDPNGEIPALSAAPLPNGAAFVDNGDGTAFFNWTPTLGQAGSYTITYTATDGALSASRSATIQVNPEWDTDGDGMADAWELEHFGNLDRDGSGDFDGDGISDLDEYLNGTDPSDGLPEPTIQSPLYDTEVTDLQPALTILNSPHSAAVTATYSFEVYADAAMTQLVAGADTVAEGQDTTAWTVPVSLEDNTGYTWRVRAYDGNVYSLWSNGRFFVNTANDPPGAFTIDAPLDGVEVDTLTPQLTVSNALDPDRDTLTYRFEVSEYIDLTSPIASVEAVSEGAGSITGWLVDVPLAENGYYYWRATAVDEHGLETPGPVAGFFVNTTNEAPFEPTVNAPADAGVLTGDTVSLVVNNGSDPDGDPLTYYFELDTVATFDGATKQVSPALTEGASTTSWEVTGLAEDTTYYWRAKASDGLIDSNWVVASFTVNAANAAPGTPTIANPGDGAWVATPQPVLSVNPVVDPDGDAVQYRFELYSDPTQVKPELSFAGAETQWQIPVTSPLVNHQWYSWRVRSEDPHGAVSGWSGLSRFFVDDNGVNDTPTLSFLKPSADVIVSGLDVKLSWEDQDPDSNATIALYYDQDNSGADGVLIVDNIQEDPDGGGDNYLLDISDLGIGTYWIYAVIDDGNTSTTTYLPASITVESFEIIVDNVAPSASWTQYWTESTARSGYYGNNYLEILGHSASPASIIIDNTDSGFSFIGNWSSASAGMGYIGTDYLEHLVDPTSPEPDGITDEASWRFRVPESNTYQLYTRLKREAVENPATAAPYTIEHASGIDTRYVNQNNYGAKWVSLGSYPFNQDVDYVVTVSGDTGGTRADAIMIEPPNAPPNTVTWYFSVPQTGTYTVQANWTVNAYNSKNAPYVVNHLQGSDTVVADQSVNGGTWNTLGEYSFEQGVNYTVTLSDAANAAVIADAIRVIPVP